MGEAVLISEGEMELQIQETELHEKKNKKKNSTTGEALGTTTSSSAVMWERFISKMAVKVLLVEADDSTRQIITALLRKCSYKVVAVSDGLKAWEVLKGKPHNIDLILTEVELPSISGYALLTLIMEHDVCKNIPVIMMSSNDSVSTVYKCMFRGAADFLVKPVRKNELRNLWQHVWRKQTSNSASGLGPPDESVAQQKDEAIAENNAVSNHSSGYMACIQRNRECIEKGSDDQSSCIKPDLESEGADSENVHCLSQPTSAKCLTYDINFITQEECRQECTKTRENNNEAGESHAITRGGQVMNTQDDSEQVNVTGQISEKNRLLENSSREAIDLIGAFDNNFLKGTIRSSPSNFSTNKFDIFPHLDLSLKRSDHPSSSENQVNDERRRLNHSDASAFSRYINKPFNPTSVAICNEQQKDHETNSEKQLPYHTPPDITFPYPQRREISLPIPVRGVRFDNVINLYGSESFPQFNTFYPSELQNSNSPQLHNLMDQRTSNAIDLTDDNKQGQKLENLEDRGLVSPSNDQSGNSSFCNGNSESRSNGKISEEGYNGHEGASHRAMLREAALNKFRLKRKERCFDKKVRYESRKKLAEQRPRVKGQFVRQVTNDSQAVNSSAG
ncbi:hypothetical protein ACJIZ3_003469 [Penstemon smallii]|uniref:Two-component response regulator-like APRR5 n=1 Tax=Penstemon smallii TaxID=265156 RepID=A0ABD3U9F1_9LAMI